ncbi:MAG: hypothetical protein GWN77_03225, partial [Gammaproteobacteria bacterium]|nr:hypothetical protein [Gammaproteobacteria bacterium]
LHPRADKGEVRATVDELFDASSSIVLCCPRVVPDVEDTSRWNPAYLSRAQGNKIV